MIERLIELALDESKWFTTALGVAFLILTARIIIQRNENVPARFRIQSSMDLAYGCVIGTMAFGHVLAVTIKTVRGSLEGSPLLLYPLGLALAIPSLWLATRSWSPGRRESATKTVTLNAVLGIMFVAGFNFALAAPAGLNILYRLHSRRAVGLTILGVTIVAYLGLFIGSLIFLAAGGSFEQFSGME